MPSLKVRTFIRSLLSCLSSPVAAVTKCAITLDMAPNMEQIARICFPAAKRVTDRFHVQKLAYEAVQEMRVKARWEALDEKSTRLLMQRPVERCIMHLFSLMEIQESSC